MMLIQVQQLLLSKVLQEIRIDFRLVEFQKEVTAKIYEKDFNLSVYEGFESSLQGSDSFDVITVKQIYSTGRWDKEKVTTGKDYSDIIKITDLPIILLMDSTSSRAFVMDGQHRIQAFYEEILRNILQEKYVHFVIFEVSDGFRFLPNNYKSN